MTRLVTGQTACQALQWGLGSAGRFGTCPSSIPSRKLSRRMRSSLKEIYRVSPMRTVPIHFYHLEPGRFNQPCLMQLKAASFRDVTPGTAKQQVEQRFRELIAGDPNLPRIFVI